MGADTLKICTINFWPGFNFPDDFLGYLLRKAFGDFEIAKTEIDADIVFTSIFGRSLPKFKNKTVWVIWENRRPNFEIANYAISSDFDSYGDRNVRCPYWYTHLAWPGFEIKNFDSFASNMNHGFEPLIPIESLSRDRSPSQSRSKFCIFVAGNPEQHRMLAVEELSKIEKVDVFGNVAGRPLRQSKLDIMPDYRFNVCFENSIFPGYYTEKVLHAWASGCVPLYFADRFLSKDFNSSAMVNRADFATLEDFVSHVRQINSSSVAQAEITSQPLVKSKPSLDHIIGFLRRTHKKIKRDARSTLQVKIPPSVVTSKPSAASDYSSARRNDPCPCGSGKKYKHCHGKPA
jgi:alpha(1,3/1,4) fucosyltransferase